MSIRRIAAGTFAVTVAGLTFLGVGIAAAHEDAPPAPEATCSAPTNGVASNSPGVTSGNVIQVPVNNCSDSLIYAPITVNNCGNTTNVLSTLNPAYGNTCVSEVDTADGS